MTQPRASINPTAPALLERLCRSLAFHLVESELTLQHASGEDLSFWTAEVAMAKALIVEAGFEMDTLYPVKDRPVVTFGGPQ
ncbi:hypothetical protein FNL56_13295 [Tardiphaga sp. vice304]|uniref:hypothetical protein n=1 Tax=Tardiphaga sp. vice304 TaxID=2592817 RepID=UPI001165682E|nr:hypothetical protein [Tardiphaga sp. vice304]QDM26976.1 hypothetical protein FNL56_13295 [Tardiphaga sp. vice304]